MKLKVKESDVLRAVLDYLGYAKIFHYRNNSGGFKNEQGRFFRFGARGSPDVIVVYRGKYIGIECKSSEGKQSESQREFQQRLEDAGGVYLLVRSVDEVAQFFKK